MNVIPLGNRDADVAVCAGGNGEWWTASVPVEDKIRKELRLELFDRLGTKLSWVDNSGTKVSGVNVYTGTQDGGVFARLAPSGPWIWLAHRAIVNETMHATLRRVRPDRTVVTDSDGVLGPADGPLALSGDWVAWHDYKAKVVYGRRLTVPLGPRVALRKADPSVVGTGLSHMDGSWPVMINENRNTVEGMIDPVRVYGLVVGKNPTGGIEVRTGEGKPQGTLLPHQITGDPRGAAQGVDYAATCWGGTGAKLVLFTAADLKEP